MTERSYRQYCGIAHALDLVGERWALLVVRELIVGPKRFTDLAHGLPGIGTNILSARLKQLEKGGVVQRRFLPPPAASTVYELTGYGRELEEIIIALGRWGARSLGPREPGESLRAGWLAVALKSLFRAEAAHGLQATYEFRLEDSVFHAVLDGESFEVGAGGAADPDLVLEAESDTLLALFQGTLATDHAVSAGLLELDGDPALLDRLVELVPMGDPEAAHG